MWESSIGKGKGNRINLNFWSIPLDVLINSRNALSFKTSISKDFYVTWELFKLFSKPEKLIFYNFGNLKN